MHAQNKRDVPQYIRAFKKFHLKFLSRFTRITLNRHRKQNEKKVWAKYKYLFG